MTDRYGVVELLHGLAEPDKLGADRHHRRTYFYMQLCHSGLNTHLRSHYGVGVSSRAGSRSKKSHTLSTSTWRRTSSGTPSNSSSRTRFESGYDPMLWGKSVPHIS